VRRLLVGIQMTFLLVGLATQSAEAGPLRVRLDPNDSSSILDIHRVTTRLSPTTMYLRLTSWDRFRLGDLQVTWGFVLDTVGNGRVDRWVGIYPTRRGLKCDVWGGRHGFDLIGRRHATRPDRKSAACHLPRGWFGHIGRAVRFRAFIEEALSRAEQDNAPDVGYYRWV
jgi:hypothetical protein